jgi:flavodoxin
MKTLVLYDSVFGNTEKIAQAIGAALGETPVLRVGDVKMEQLSGINLLLVGSPTRGFRPTEATTQFLKNIPHDALKGVRAAAFDTRMVVEEVGSPILSVFTRIFGCAASLSPARSRRRVGSKSPFRRLFCQLEAR